LRRGRLVGAEFDGVRTTLLPCCRPISPVGIVGTVATTRRPASAQERSGALFNGSYSARSPDSTGNAYRVWYSSSTGDERPMHLRELSIVER
jgi:hypothetical protein